MRKDPATSLTMDGELGVLVEFVESERLVELLLRRDGARVAWRRRGRRLRLVNKERRKERGRQIKKQTKNYIRLLCQYLS